MAREGITYDQVSAAADALLGEGQKPTIRAIRDYLGTGSPNTVHRHLTKWRDGRPHAVATAPELPASLTTAIAAEIERAAAQARAEIEEQLVQAQAEAVDLASAGEALEIELDELTEQVTVLTRERDTLAGKAAQQAVDLAEQAQRIEREQTAAEAARVDLATARLKIEAQAEKQAEQTAEIERLRAALEASQQARQQAEQQAAVLAAKLEGMTDRATKAEASAVDLTTQVHKVREAAGLEGSKSEMKQATIATLTGKLEALQAELQQRYRDLDTTQQAEKKALQEAAELRGKLAALLEREKQAK